SCRRSRARRPSGATYRPSETASRFRRSSPTCSGAAVALAGLICWPHSASCSGTSGTGVGGSPVVVVAVTNGVVVARGVSFYKPQPAPQVLVAQLKAQSLVASLPGVRLFFVGLGRVPGGIGLQKARWIEQFWLHYARAAGATPVLVRSVDDLITRLGGAA